MPLKVCELVTSLEKAGSRKREGKGGHRNYANPNVSKPVTISGKLGDDAKKYQIRTVDKAVQEAEK